MWGKKHRSFPSNKQKEVQPIASKSHKDEFIRTERFQFSCGRVIRVVSVFPKQGTETPEDKLKALARWNSSKENCAPKGLDISDRSGYCGVAML